MKSASIFAILACASLASAQDPDALAAARQFTAQLTLDPAADAKLFQAAGIDRSSALLLSVFTFGQSKQATPDDWKALHKALAGITELWETQGQTFKAAIFAGMQESLYNTLERDYASALAAGRQALALQEQAGERATLSIPHYAIGGDLLNLGRLPEAIAELRTALTLEPTPLTAASATHWRKLVTAQIAAGDLASADAETQRFLDAAPGAPPLFRARALLAQADLQIARRNFAATLDTVKQARALDLDPKDRDSFDIDASYELLVCVLDSMHGSAYDETLRLAAQIDRDFQNLAISVTPFAHLAVTARRRLAGDLEGVLHDDYARLEQARAAKNVAGQIESLRSLATTYSALHARAQQIAVLEEALPLSESMLAAATEQAREVDLQQLLNGLDALGFAYADDRQSERARVVFARMLKIIAAETGANLRQKLKSLESDAHLGQAQVAELQEDPDSARDLLAAEVKRNPGSAFALLQLARLERNLNEKPARAAELYASAANAFAAVQERAQEITVRLEMVRYLAANLSKIPDALATARKQLTDAEAGMNALHLADAEWLLHFDKGLLAEAEGAQPEAEREYRAAVEKIEQIRAGLSQSERQSFLDAKLSQDIYARLIALLAAEHKPADAWQYLERGKARGFAEMLHGRRVQGPAAESSQTSALRGLDDRITALRGELAPQGESILRGSGRSPAAMNQELQDLEKRFLAARQEAAVDSTRSGQALSLRPPDLGAIQKLLPPHTALIEYALLTDSIGAFIVTNSSQSQRFWPVNVAALRRRALGLGTYLSSPNSGDTAMAEAAQIAQLVFEPIARDLPAGTQRLIVVPAAELYYLPFQIFPAGDGALLIDRYSISYLPNAAALEYLAKDTPFGGKVFLGALGGVSVEGMAPLPGTLRETNGIAQIYPAADRASEAALTHDRVKRALLESDEVHLATHGIFDKDAPLFSAVLTSPAPGQASRLNLYEIADLPLKARLVVLSACETAKGQLQGGDEIAGLTRTFLTAGASTVVSSLWKVSDDSTALLMQEFYRSMRAGHAPAEAMREAALAVRKQFPHPFYWAPFIVTGAH